MRSKILSDSLPISERPDLTLITSEHIEKTGDSTSNDETETSTQFEWDYDVITNLVALVFCFTASAFALIVPNSSIRFITDRFPEDASSAVWVAGAVSVANCVAQSFSGDLSDIFGRRVFLFVGMSLGIIGTIISGRANNMQMVIAGQALNGTGLTFGFLVYPLIAEITPKTVRPQIQALVGIFSAVSYCAGPILVGVFVKYHVGGQHEGWRVGFYLTAGFYALALVLLLIFYHPSPRPNPDGQSIAQRLRLIDWVGIFLITTGLTAFLVGLQYGGNPYAWDSATVLACIILGLACAGAFLVWEWKFAKNRLCPAELFEHRNYGISLALASVGGIVLFGGQAYLPQEILSLFTSDAILTGVFNLPFNLASSIGSIVAAAVLAWTREAKWIVVASMVICTIGGGLMAVMQPDINFVAWFFPSAILGISLGVQQLVLVIVVSICTPNHLIATAISVLGCVRAAGGSIGLVMFQQVFLSRIKIELPRLVKEAAIGLGFDLGKVTLLLEAVLRNDPAAISEIPGMTPEILEQINRAVQQANANSYRFVWYTLIPCAAVSFGLSLLLGSTKAQMTMEVAAAVRHKPRAH